MNDTKRRTVSLRQLNFLFEDTLNDSRILSYFPMLSVSANSLMGCVYRYVATSYAYARRNKIRLYIKHFSHIVTNSLMTITANIVNPKNLKIGLQLLPDLDMGPFSSTQPNPTH